MNVGDMRLPRPGQMTATVRLWSGPKAADHARQLNELVTALRGEHHATTVARITDRTAGEPQ